MSPAARPPHVYKPCQTPSNGPCPRLREYEALCRLLDPQGRSGGIYNRRRIGGSNAWSVHACGRALDWFPSSRAVGDRIAEAFTGATRPADTQLVIWWGRQWGGRAGPGWRHYAGTHRHTDHLHIESNVCAGEWWPG